MRQKTDNKRQKGKKWTNERKKNVNSVFNRARPAQIFFEVKQK
jgi:hypothetical protein